MNPENKGSKAALHYQFELAPGEQRVIELWLTAEADPAATGYPAVAHAKVLADREREADEFYGACLTPQTAEQVTADETRIMRQAYSGLIWSKQFYHYDVHRWVHGDHKN